MKRSVLALSTAVILAAAPVYAAEPPVLGGGPGVYSVNGQDDVANVGCGDTLTFKIRIHNTASSGAADDFSEAQSVVVKATLPTGEVSNFTSTATITSSNANTVTDSVIVNLEKPAAIEFVSGPAGITQGGASVGDVRKLKEVSFTAKVTCPETPVVTTTPPTPGKGSAPAPVVTAAPKPLAATGPETSLFLGALLTALLGLTYGLTRGRKPHTR